MANEEKGVKARAHSQNVPRIKRFSDNDLDQLTTAVSVALGALADVLTDLTQDAPSTVTEERVTFLRQLSQEVQRLGIPF